MAGKLLAHLRDQWIGVIALLLVLTGGTAYALDGSNTVFTDDIVNGEVKVADIGQGAVATDEIANSQVKSADLGDGEVRSAEIANGQVMNADIGAGQVRGSHVLNDNLTGTDVAANSLKGADIDEATLDIGDAARAYAYVDASTCAPAPGACNVKQAKGVSTVTRDGTGTYCVTAPGIDATVTPAAVTVDWTSPSGPEGNASAMTEEGSVCGSSGQGFLVITDRQPEIAVDAGGGTNNATAAGSANFADDISFTIVIP
jgi:hypothetical protein